MITRLVLLGLVLGLAACGDARARVPTPTPEPTATPVQASMVLMTRLPTRTPTPLPTATPSGGCSIPTMLPGQHLSASGSYTQTETKAAGPMVCHIKRNSCAYYKLVGDLSPAITFKREEEPPFDEEDILIHPAMLGPLTRLSQLVAAEWGGTYWLRVTDAYDSILEHDLAQSDPSLKYSLHFEGRSVDLTTWPVDTSRYGRLCALAHCAGFDWVHHEGDHCHASINAESLCVGCGK